MRRGFTQTHRDSSGPAGRPSQSECLISYFWFSYFVDALSSVPPPSFLNLLPETDSPFPVPHRARPFSTIRTRSTSRHRPCKLESSRGSVLAANSRVLDEIDRIRDGDHLIGISRSSDLKIKASSWIFEGSSRRISILKGISRETKFPLCPRSEISMRFPRCECSITTEY